MTSHDSRKDMIDLFQKRHNIVALVKSANNDCEFGKLDLIDCVAVDRSIVH